MRRLLLRVRESARISLMLRIYSLVSVALIAAAFLYAVYCAYADDPLSAVRLLASLGIPFLAVSAARLIINAPRPYEIYTDIYETPPKSTGGRSFPSRHAYSAFAISVCVFPVSTLAGVVLIFVSALMCLSRVLLGIHFIRDVAAGALIGVISQLIGMLIIKSL